MADVILITPRTQWDIKNITTRLPLASLYIGSVLEEQGFKVQIIDQRVDENWAISLRQALEERPLWVGVSSMTGRQIQWGLAASQIVRESDPTIPVMWGGVHPTILPDQTLAHLLVDLVAVGEGEITALELTRCLAANRGQDWREVDLSAIDGLVWQRDGRNVHNAPRSATDMNEWPRLHYDLVHVPHYILAEGAGERSLQMTTSRGCPMKCGYCYLGVVPDGRCYRAEDAERTVERIEYITKTFGVDTVHIIDDEFFTQFKRARQICQMILDRGIKVILRANCRIDYINRMSLDDLKLFHKAGFEHIYLGAESGTDRVLELMGKGITVEQTFEANRKLKKAGIAPKFSFMGGFPTETMDEVKKTLRLMVRLVSENSMAYTSPVQLFSPYPGTPLFDLCLEMGMPMPNSLEGWAEWAWETDNCTWRTRREEKLLGKIALFSFFLDGKTVPESSQKTWFRWAARLYGAVVRTRARLGFFAFMPEIRAIRWEYNNLQRRQERSRKKVRHPRPPGGGAGSHTSNPEG